MVSTDDTSDVTRNALQASLTSGNLGRMWWLLITSTILSVGIAILAAFSTVQYRLSVWSTLDIGGSIIFLVVFWLARRDRFSPTFRRWLGPAYFAFWLLLMNGYFSAAIPSVGFTTTYALGTLAPAILIVLPPRIVIPLIAASHAAFCSILIRSAPVAAESFHESALDPLINGTLAALIAVLASSHLYRSVQQNFATRHAILARESDALAAEARLRAMLENMPFQAWLKDTDSRFLAVNREFLDGHQLPEDAVIGHTNDEVYSSDRSRKYTVEDQDVIRSGQRLQLEERIESSAGTRWFEVFKHPVFDKTNTVSGIAGFARDITTRKQMVERLRAADRAKSNFLASMSHEIRTPLNSVLGYAELLEQDLTEPEQLAHARSIRESGELLLTLITDILDVSKIEAGQMTVVRESISVAQIVERIDRMFRPLAGRNHLDYRSTIDADVPDTLLGDAHRMTQVLANLVSNAIKFTESGSVELRVTTQLSATDTALLRFEVTDTGTGIPPDEISRLFQPFTQLDSTHTRRHEGTGLGLVIARNLCELMGGSLTITSDGRSGSTFTATILAIPAPLPDVISSLPDPSLAAPDAAEPDLRRLRVLVTEDNPINRRLVAAVLARWGVDTTLASTAHEALDLLAENTFDVILMDVQMPEMDGVEATRCVRLLEKARPGAPPAHVIAFTALASEADQSACRIAGMDDFLSKPLSIPALRTALARAPRASQ